MKSGEEMPYRTLVRLLAVTGLVFSFIMVALYHENPFRIPVFANIPVCYIYGNLYSLILIAYILNDSLFTKIMAIAGILAGFLVSVYFLFLYAKFSSRGYIFTAEILGIKTVYVDYMLFTMILLNVLFRRKKWIIIKRR